MTGLLDYCCSHTPNLSSTDASRFRRDQTRSDEFHQRVYRVVVPRRQRWSKSRRIINVPRYGGDCNRHEHDVGDRFTRSTRVNYTVVCTDCICNTHIPSYGRCGTMDDSRLWRRLFPHHVDVGESLDAKSTRQPPHTSPSRRVTVVHSYLASRIAPPSHLILLSGASREKQRKKEEKGAALDGGYCAGQLGTINRNIFKEAVLWSSLLLLLFAARLETYIRQISAPKSTSRKRGVAHGAPQRVFALPSSLVRLELHIVYRYHHFFCCWPRSPFSNIVYLASRRDGPFSMDEVPGSNVTIGISYLTHVLTLPYCARGKPFFPSALHSSLST